MVRVTGDGVPRPSMAKRTTCDGVTSTSFERRSDSGEECFKVRTQSKTRDDESETTLLLQDDGSWKPRAECLQMRHSGPRVGEYAAVSQKDGQSLRNSSAHDQESEVRSSGLRDSRKMSDGETRPMPPLFRNSRASDEESEATLFLHQDCTWNRCPEYQQECTKGSEEYGEKEVSQVRSSRLHDSTKMQPTPQSLRNSKAIQQLCQGYEDDDDSEILQPDGALKKVSQGKSTPQSLQNPRAILQARQSYEDEGESEIMQPDGTFKKVSQVMLPPQSLRNSRNSCSHAGSQSRNGSQSLTASHSRSGSQSRVSLQRGREGDEEAEILQTDVTFTPASQLNPMPQSLRSSRASERSCTQGHEDYGDGQQLSRSLTSSRASQRSCTQGHQVYGDGQPMSQSLRNSKGSQPSCTEGHGDYGDVQQAPQILRSCRGSQRSCTQGHEEYEGEQQVPQSLRSSQGSQRSFTPGNEAYGDEQQLPQSLRSCRGSQLSLTQGHEDYGDGRPMSQSLRSCTQGYGDYGEEQQVPHSIRSSRASERSCTQGHEEYGVEQHGHEEHGGVPQSLRSCRGSRRSCTSGHEEYDGEQQVPQSLRSSQGSQRSFTPGNDDYGHDQQAPQSLRSCRASQLSLTQGLEEHVDGQPISKNLTSSRGSQRSCTQGHEECGDGWPMSQSLRSPPGSQRSCTQEHKDYGDAQQSSHSLRSSRAIQRSCTKGHDEESCAQGTEQDGESEILQPDGMWKAESQEEETVNVQKDVSIKSASGFQQDRATRHVLGGGLEILQPDGTFLALQPDGYIKEKIQMCQTARTSQSLPYPLLLKLDGVRLEGDPKVMKALSAMGVYALDDGNLVNIRPVYRHMVRPSLVLAFSGKAWFVQPEKHIGRDKGCMCLVDTSLSPDRAKDKMWWVFDNESFVEQPSVCCNHYMDIDLKEKIFPQNFAKKQSSSVLVKEVA